MKKNGFTLAEVLITLAIIGVVAMMTLPALMTNTAEQQAKTSLKKGISTLTDAAQMNATVKGFDYGAITSDDTSDEDKPSLWALLSTQLAVNPELSGTNKGYIKGEEDSEGSNYALYLRDGSSIMFDPSHTMKSSPYNDIEDDALPHGIPIIFDTNGKKGPNVLSNCTGKAIDATSDSATEDESDCSDKSNRVFKDQYGLRLRNSVVVPNGAAARYIVEN